MRGEWRGERRGNREEERGEREEGKFQKNLLIELFIGLRIAITHHMDCVIIIR